MVALVCLHPRPFTLRVLRACCSEGAGRGGWQHQQPEKYQRGAHFEWRPSPDSPSAELRARSIPNDPFDSCAQKVYARESAIRVPLDCEPFQLATPVSNPSNRLHCVPSSSNPLTGDGDDIRYVQMHARAA